MLNVFKKWLDQIFIDEESILLLVLIAAGLLLLVTMGYVLGPILTSLVVAFMMQGLKAQLIKYGVPQWLAVTIAYLIFIGTLLLLLLVILPQSWHQMVKLFDELPGMLNQWQQLLLVLPERYPEYFSAQQVSEWIVLARAEIGKMGQWVLSFSIASIPNLLAVLIYLVIVPILVFFFLKDRDLILGWMGSFLPNERPMLNKVWHEMNEQVANYLRGKAVEIFIVGVVSYFCFAVLGLNYAALMGLLVGLSVVIPYIGAAMVTIPIAMVGYFQWGWGSEFFTLMIVYGVVQALDGNVLVPLLFSEAVNLHPVAIILAVLVFGGLWGFWGVFFAIPLATLIKAVLNAWPSQELSEQAADATDVEPA